MWQIDTLGFPTCGSLNVRSARKVRWRKAFGWYICMRCRIFFYHDDSTPKERHGGGHGSEGKWKGAAIKRKARVATLACPPLSERRWQLFDMGHTTGRSGRGTGRGPKHRGQYLTRKQDYTSEETEVEDMPSNFVQNAMALLMKRNADGSNNLERSRSRLRHYYNRG